MQRLPVACKMDSFALWSSDKGRIFFPCPFLTSVLLCSGNPDPDFSNSIQKRQGRALARRTDWLWFIGDGKIETNNGTYREDGWLPIRNTIRSARRVRFGAYPPSKQQSVAQCIPIEALRVNQKRNRDLWNRIRLAADENEPTSDAQHNGRKWTIQKEVYDLNLVSPCLFSYYIYWSIRFLDLPAASYYNKLLKMNFNFEDWTMFFIVWLVLFNAWFRDKRSISVRMVVGTAMFLCKIYRINSEYHVDAR